MIHLIRRFREWRAWRRWRRHWESLTPLERETIRRQKRVLESTFFYGPRRS